MSADDSRITVDQMYASGPLTELQIDELLDQSRHPRGPEFLFEVAGDIGVDASSRVLDIGSGNGRHVIELARRFGCRTVGVEFVWDHLSAGFPDVEDLRANEPEVARLIALAQGSITALPFAEGTFDLVWSRDMLIHIADLRGALVECRRVLRPGGAMVVFQMFATPLLEPREASRLWPALAAVEANTDPVRFEAVVGEAGLEIERREELGSEWREYLEESGPGKTSRQLLHVARLLRDEERFRELLGDVDYRVSVADRLWGVYQMIGKLSPRVYVLRPRP
jgi:SAM-dependent methyltransferase